MAFASFADGALMAKQRATELTTQQLDIMNLKTASDASFTAWFTGFDYSE